MLFRPQLKCWLFFVQANVGDRVKDFEFTRALAGAIFEDSIPKNKLQPEVLTGHGKLLQKYVDNDTSYELQCLYVLQSLVHKLEHPSGKARRLPICITGVTLWFLFQVFCCLYVINCTRIRLSARRVSSLGKRAQIPPNRKEKVRFLNLIWHQDRQF